MKIRQAAQLMGASSGAGEEFFDKEISGFSIDSRAIAPGELFFALSAEDYRRHSFTGESFADAHEFIPQAFESGAMAVVARTERVEGDAQLAPFRERLLLVDDVIEALQVVAQKTLAAWDRPVVGITGSAGKTTAKNLTAHILGVMGRRVLSSQKNFNNELGVPLSVLQMVSNGARPEDFDVAVLEMGMSMPGEIARLCVVAPPDISVVLLVAPVHLEFMGTIETIAEAKGQLVEGLKPGGIAVLNADDERVAAMRAKHRTGRTLTFGLAETADVRALNVESKELGLTRFRLRTPHGESDVRLPMPGRHNVTNALAAASVATCFDIAPEVIADALASSAPSKMRGEVLHFDGDITVVDDSYNSNPRSLLSMSEAIAHGGADMKRRIIVAGEMLELGADSKAIHRETGREIGKLGVDIFWGVRGHARELVEGTREGGMGEAATKFFESSEEAAAALVEFVQPGDLVLVKGSRGVHTEIVVGALKERYEQK